MVVNPTWRELEKQRNAARGKLTRRRAKFVAIDSEPAAASSHERHEKWETRKAGLLEDMDCFSREVERLAQEKKDVPHHITWKQLSEEDKFMKLPGSRRRLVNTVGMIAYRAETAMGSSMCGDDKKLSMSAARAILQDLFVTPADLIPTPDANRLEVRVHGASTPATNRRLATLFERLNETETIYPGTDLKMVFKCLHPPPEKSQMVSPNLPRDQEI